MIYRMEVTKLQEGEWYAYRVKALNRQGASKPSKPTDDIQAVDAMGNFSGYIKTSLAFFKLYGGAVTSVWRI